MQKEAKVLTAKGRNQIKQKNFALPAQKKYPIHDQVHGKAALARVAQHGTPAERVQVRKAVYARYPSLKKEAAYEVGFMNELERLTNV